MELKKQTLGSLREMLDTKQISAAELCKEYSDSIKAKDSDVLGYITVTEDEALKNAEKAQEIIDKGERFPENSQIAKEINYFLDFYGDIFPAVYLCYDRTAYFGADDPDLRITFDRNISWRTEDINLKVEPYGEQILDIGYSLMEIKAAGSMPLWLAELLAQGGIKQTSFSKYGMAYMTMLRRSMGIRTKKVKSEVTVNV